MSIVVGGSFETAGAQARLIIRCKNERPKVVNVLAESVLSQEMRKMIPISKLSKIERKKTICHY